MKQQYFILVLAHSLHGRLRRIHIPHTFIYGVLALALLGCISLFGFVSSYVRMAWKVANYNSLRQEVASLRARYDNLQKTANQTKEQLATLQMFASEVSVAYGIKRKLEGPADIASEGSLRPTFSESLEEYQLLRTAVLTQTHRRLPSIFQTNARPSIWPVEGVLRGGFGSRIDPFSGEGAWHTGVDISAPVGTPVRSTADGMVLYSGPMSGYGKLLVVDHGSGFRTYYAHLSRLAVMHGQEVRRGDIIGAVGITGRATAPHLHYEVRQGGSPVNPYSFLASRFVSAKARQRDLPF